MDGDSVSLGPGLHQSVTMEGVCAAAALRVDSNEVLLLRVLLLETLLSRVRDMRAPKGQVIKLAVKP